MFPSLRSVLANFAALVVIVAGIFFILNRSAPVAVAPAQPVATTSPAAFGASAQTATAAVAATSTKPVARKTTSAAVTQAAAQKPANQVSRIEEPYAFSFEGLSAVSDATRLALVNILCVPKREPSHFISGSGVIIDPRGVILTNAHIAQYVLLSQSPRVDLSCAVRTGSPAVIRWIPEVLYLPPAWVEEHAHEISDPRPEGTGEHDYALLRIARPVDDSAFPSAFPFLSVDAREAAGFQGDNVFVASYPAEFLGSAAQSDIYAVPSVARIGQLITFGTSSVDVLSLGGIIEAQSGSSGGAVVSARGRLIALIATTSGGETTLKRDLHALTLSYINRDLAAQSGFDLATLLGGDIIAQAQDFQAHTAPRLVGLYLDILSKPR